jgi:hypothetical protein
VKYRPDDAELLDAIAGLLEGEVLPAVPPELQHKVRVASNLARILQRGQMLEPSARERERGLLTGLLGRDGTLEHLRGELDARLATSAAGLDQTAVWETLVAVARDDLAIAKPGYDSWEGE